MTTFAPRSLRRISFSTAAAKFIFAVAFLALTTVATFAQQTAAPAKVDHLTVDEDDAIHETQEIDLRVAVFIKAVERRFVVLNGGTYADKKQQKDLEKLGALPVGTRPEMLADINRILEESVNNIDNLAERDPKNKLLLKSLQMFSEACTKFAAQLKPLEDKAVTDRERELIYNSIRTCEEVIEAAGKN